MLYIAADHAGYALKEHLKRYLAKHTIEVQDLGAYAFKKTDDYPDYAFALAKKVTQKKPARGILLCGSGQGMCIAVNRVKGIRAVSAWDNESAIASRRDDDANVLCLAARMLTKKRAENILRSWLFTGFSGLSRHKRRLQKIEKSR